jgi:hypothetical protein
MHQNINPDPIPNLNLVISPDLVMNLYALLNTHPIINLDPILNANPVIIQDSVTILDLVIKSSSGPYLRANTSLISPTFSQECAFS